VNANAAGTKSQPSTWTIVDELYQQFGMHSVRVASGGGGHGHHTICKTNCLFACVLQ
jgi:hypothetical protein